MAEVVPARQANSHGACVKQNERIRGRLLACAEGEEDRQNRHNASKCASYETTPADRLLHRGLAFEDQLLSEGASRLYGMPWLCKTQPRVPEVLEFIAKRLSATPKAMGVLGPFLLKRP